MANVKDLLVNGSARVIGTIYGNATSADKLNTNAGSASQPIYFSNGKPVAITGTLGNNISGNAASATKLQTARTINGTSFDGTANITTANWGTARTLTIGNTGKSVNGSGNVSWTLAEIGAAAASHNHTSLTGVTSIAFNAEASDTASIKTTIDGTATYFDFMLSDDYSNDQWRWRFSPSGGTIYDAMKLNPTAQGKADLYVGGTKVSLEGHTHNYAGSASAGGAANSANKLTTARTISLTGSVTGSGSFDGSGNLSIATATNHTHSYLPLSGGTMNGSIKFNSNSLPQKTLSYICGIDAFANGGEMGWQSKEDFLSGCSKTNHTHSYAGSASVGGSANSAVKLDSSAGSATQPIYFSGGKPIAITGTIANNISGNAATATKLGTSTIGSSIKPIYLNGGTATACSYELGANIKAYSGSLSSGGWAALNGKGNDPSIAIAYNNSPASWNSSTYSASLVFGCVDTRGLLDCAYSKPIVTFGGCHYAGASDDSPAWYMKLSGTNGKIYTFPTDSKTLCASDGSNASGIWGINITGNAATATKLGTTTVGGTTTPIYLNGGVPTALGYTIAKSVPSDAKFTDTTYSAGTGLSLSGTTFNHKNSVTAATAQGDASKTLTFGGTFTIPTVTYDAQGHITAKGTTTMTMPANPNTWRGIQNNLTSDSTTDSLSAAQGKALKALVDGKAASSHTHNYLPLSGGTLTGKVYSNIGNVKLSSADAPAHFIGNLHCYTGHGSGGAITDGYVNAITFGKSTTTAYAGIYSPSSGSYGNYLMFATTDSYADGAKTRMVINHIGNVGIGTTAPSYKLHVIGDIYANGGWLRTSGQAGWYNESYGGGWYMTDTNFIRNYNSKPVSISIDRNNAWGIGTHRLALSLKGTDHVSLLLSTDKIGYGLCANNDGNWYWGKRTTSSETSASGDTYILYGNTTFLSPNSNNAVSLGDSNHQWSAVYGVKVYGAVWNDYAEYRKSTELEPGRCVIEVGDGSLIRSFGRLEPGAEIVSDTFGFAIGETDECKTPLAVSGRVLAYPAEDRESYKPGDAVCSGPNGTVSKMTRQEIREWPDRIIGTVSEIPNYETWGTGNVPVNGRIWIRIR